MRTGELGYGRREDGGMGEWGHGATEGCEAGRTGSCFVLLPQTPNAWECGRGEREGGARCFAPRSPQVGGQWSRRTGWGQLRDRWEPGTAWYGVVSARHGVWPDGVPGPHGLQLRDRSPTSRRSRLRLQPGPRPPRAVEGLDLLAGLWGPLSLEDGAFRWLLGPRSPFLSNVAHRPYAASRVPFPGSLCRACDSRAAAPASRGLVSRLEPQDTR